MSRVVFTKHALERFNERFPEMDIEDQYFVSGRTGGGIKKRVKRSCSAHSELWGGHFKGQYLRRGKGIRGSDIIFVMAPPETVITVLDLAKMPKK